MELFGRHVGDVPRLDPVAGQVGAGQLGDAEVDDLGLAARRDHDVGRLDVAVDDAGVVGSGEPACDLRAEGDDALDRQRPALDVLLERLALVAGHDDEHPAVDGLVDVVDGADVRVVERRGGLGFLTKRRVASGSRVIPGGRNFSATRRLSRVSWAL